MATQTKERYSSVLHNRHGWIDAPEGMWIEQSDNLKSFWLCGDPGEGFFSYPFGTRWNATSILSTS